MGVLVDLSKEEKLQLVEEILLSKTFKKASTSSALLRYLSNADIDGAFLKESIIDIDFFGQKNDSETGNNNRVRVSIYNLRKKLQDYYDEEGKDNLWRICIDKGQYRLRFEKAEHDLAVHKNGYPFFKILPYFLLVITLGLLLVNVWPDRKPAIWKRVFDNGYGTTLYVGDAFGFRGKTISGAEGWTRDYNINGTEDFYAMIERNPDLKEKVVPSNYYYVTDMAVLATYSLSKLFYKYHTEFKIRNATTATYNDIKEGNSIYVGMIRDKGKFLTLFNDLNPLCKLKNDKVTIKKSGSTKDTTISIASNPDLYDMAIVSKIEGPHSTEQLFFFSMHDMGVVATVDYFTNSDSLKSFSDKYLKDQSHFTAIFKAHGRDRTSLNLETIIVVPF